MEKFYTITIEGAINKILEIQGLFDEIDVDEYEDFLSIQELPENQFDRLNTIEKVVKSLSDQGYSISLHKQGRSSDYTDEDLEERELISFSCFSNSQMNVLPPLPVERKKCSGYRNWAVFLKETTLINAEIYDYGSELTPFLSHVQYYFIQKDLLQELESLGINQGLKIRPVRLFLKDSNQVLENEYFWIYSTTSLGNLAGDISMGKFDENCQHPEILENRNFVTTFSRSNHTDKDFYTSNFLGANDLYISNRVYKFLKQKRVLHSDLYQNLIFSPVDLV